ncbi:amidase [Streptomyces sp. NPDC058045]|uniref:amidase n=1 Tax=Streptomyces sp. NPDC058045 TaxID=3346311 RepID=UPI0036E6C593
MTAPERHPSPHTDIPTGLHTYTDDALGAHDAVALAALVRRREVSPAEAARDAAARLRAAEGLGALAATIADPAPTTAPDGPLAGVPTLVKDNSDYRGLPTGHGSAAFTPAPARRHAPFVRQLLSTGVTVLGKTRLPEFGFNATTEFEHAAPVRNPWHTAHSPGGSSGGAAALVAAGAVPVAHANDGGGSIRIPAACCGLVGLKPTRGRVRANAQSRQLPIDLVTDGILSRTVRDTAAFLAAAETHWRNPELPPLGLVEGPSGRRLRVGLLLDSPTGVPTDPATRAAVTATATTLEGLGHTVRPVRIPLDDQFTEDFLTYWGMLSFLLALTGRTLGAHFDRHRMDPLSQGLRAQYVRAMRRTPAVLHRLRKSREAYAAAFRGLDAILAPVVAHTTPRLGHLSPAVPYPTLIARILAYVAFTPLDNTVGTPSVSLPSTATTPEGLPIGVMFSARPGHEHTLLDLAYTLEAANPFRRLGS